MTDKKHFLSRYDFVYKLNSPLVISKSQGAVLTDIDGFNYLDIEAANGSVSLGYDNSILDESIAKVRDITSLPCFCESPLRIGVGDKIAQALNSITGTEGRIAFELGGAQAMELAVKAVRSNTNKSQYVVFEGGYHGRSAFTSQFSASQRYRSIVGDWRLPVIRLPYPDCDQCRFSQHPANCQTECISYVKQLNAFEFGGTYSQKSGTDVAAFIFEPLLNAGGMALPDKRYLNYLVDFYRSQGALIVVDEIFSGWHRTGKMWAFQHYGIQPDIVVMSKAITNGMAPLSCVWARDPIMLEPHFPPGSHSLTFGNNTLSLSIADTVIDRFTNWAAIEGDVAILEGLLGLVVKRLVDKYPAVVKSGYVIGAAGRFLLQGTYGGKITELARTIARDHPVDDMHGLILANSSLAPNVIVFKPPLNIDLSLVGTFEKLMDMTFAAFEKLNTGI